MSDRSPFSPPAPETADQRRKRRRASSPETKVPKKVNQKFRRQILQGAFDDNVDLLANQPLGTTRRDREKRRRRIRRWLFGSTMAVVLVVSAVSFTTLSPAAAKGASTPVIRTVNLPDRIDDDAEVAQPPLSILSATTLVPGMIPLGVHRVAIDPGHGGRDSGTSLQFGLLEKDLTLDLGRRLRDILVQAGIECTLTRDSDVEVSLADRAARANAARADLFISIHVNWLPDRSARGFETYYLGPSDDPFLSRLALTENRDSGFTVADTRRLLDGIYADVRRTESRRLAQSIQSSLFDVLKRDNDQVKSRGVMSAPFVVLVATEMPAVLAEVACLSNEREARLLAIPSYRQHIAEGLAEGILQYAYFVGGTAPNQGDQG